MRVEINKKVLELANADIVLQKTDAIVNAANGQLKLGGGVAGAIRRAGGPSIQEECDKKAPISAGEAVITTGGALKAKYVIHAVGPRMGEGDEPKKLRNAVLNSLRVADENNLRSISFPAISTGIFGFPLEPAAKIMLAAAIEYLKGETNIHRIVFVLLSYSDYKIFEATLKSLPR